MKIYTNEAHEIIAIKEPPIHYVNEYDVERDTFEGWCDACILGFKYQPMYADDGTIMYYHAYIYANWPEMVAMNNVYRVEIEPMSKTIDDLLMLILA